MGISKTVYLPTAFMAAVLAGPAFGQTATTTEPRHGPLASFKWEGLPNYGGSAALIHRSPDGKRVAVANKEEGSFDYTYEFDEFLFVTSGRAKLQIIGGETFFLNKGDVAYIVKGTKVHFDVYKGFSDVTMLMSDDKPVDWK